MAAGLRSQNAVRRVDVLPPGNGFAQAVRTTAARHFVVDCGNMALTVLTSRLDTIRTAHAAACILVLAPDDRETTRTILRHGVTGLVTAGQPMEHCLSALQQLEQGHSWLPADLVGDILNGHQPARTNASIDQLPPRQRQIFDLIGSGMSTRDIASLLGIGIKTVETHRMRLMQHLGLRNAHELVVRAVQAKNGSA